MRENTMYLLWYGVYKLIYFHIVEIFTYSQIICIFQRILLNKVHV